jgi:hypothetical protein
LIDLDEHRPSLLPGGITQSKKAGPGPNDSRTGLEARVQRIQMTANMTAPASAKAIRPVPKTTWVVQLRSTR